MNLKADPTSFDPATSRLDADGPTQEAFFDLADDLPALCWAADATGDIFWFNRRWYAYTGTTPASQLGSAWHVVIDPHHRARVVAALQTAIEQGQPLEVVFSLRRADGAYRTFLTRAEPKRNDRGEIVRWYGTSVDITAQADTEASLRESEIRLRTLAEALPDHVWAATPTGELDWFNSRVYEFCGATPGELDGSRWGSIVHEDDLPGATEKWQQSLASGEIYETEFRLLRRDGDYRWFLARAVPTRDATGRIIQWIGTNTDIHDQKKSAQALWENERRFVLSQNAARIASMELDVATGTVIGSDNFWDVWGLARRDSVHSSVLENIVLPEDAHVRSTASSRHDGTAPREVEYRIRRPDNGAIRWLSRSIDFVRDEKGAPVKMFGIIQDITDRKTSELALRESEERYRAALVVGRMGSWETNFVTRQRLWSPEGQALFGLSLPGGIGTVGGSNDEYFHAMHPDDRHLVKTFHDLCNKVDSFPASYRVLRPDGSVVWVAGRGQVFSRTPDGRCERLVSVMADVTEQRRSEQHVRFLMREMSHRSKNLLAIIQSIARQTMRNAATMTEFQSKFGDRLRGLAASHDILVDQDWHGADLAELVRRHLTPFIDAGSPRLVLNGPPVDLNSNAAQSIGLGLHELATNAVKYGALSVPGGRVFVSWSFGQAEDGSETLTFNWTERGGPAVSQPTRKGFGNEVIGRLVPASLLGTVSIDYRPEGLELKLTIPASAVSLREPSLDPNEPLDARFPPR